MGRATTLNPPRKAVTPVNTTEKSISTAIHTAPGRRPSNQRLTQRATDYVPNTSSQRQESKDDVHICKGIPLGHFARHRRPGGRERTREDTIRDAEDVQHGQTQREAPEQEHSQRASYRGEEDARRVAW